MAYNLQEQARAHARPNRFHQRQKTRDGWRAIIVQRAIRYSAWRVEEYIHIYRRAEEDAVEQGWGRGGRGGKGERAWYTFNTGPEEPPAQQVHRRWFSSSFSLAALRLSSFPRTALHPAYAISHSVWTTLSSSSFTRRGTEVRLFCRVRKEKIDR